MEIISVDSLSDLSGYEQVGCGCLFVISLILFDLVKNILIFAVKVDPCNLLQPRWDWKLGSSQDGLPANCIEYIIVTWDGLYLSKCRYLYEWSLPLVLDRSNPFGLVAFREFLVPKRCGQEWKEREGEMDSRELASSAQLRLPWQSS